jgi:hypothetical protein
MPCMWWMPPLALTTSSTVDEPYTVSVFSLD